MNERVYNNEIDRLRSPQRSQRLEVTRVADFISKDNSIKSILDIGTGSGLFAEEFIKLNLKVTGIDSNPQMIEAAKDHVPETEFQIASAENLPFEDKSFDAAFLGVVFHEVDDYLKTLQEARRVSTSAVYILEWEYINEEFGPPLEHRLSQEFIEQLAREAGFRKTEIHRLKNLVLYKMS
jgi:ubiquinone/menaquinone biosynthesis C-methylase UbiE